LVTPPQFNDPVIPPNQEASHGTYIGRRNFVTYAHRAAQVMGSKAILKQLKPHLRRFKEYLERKNRQWFSWTEEKFQAYRKRYLS
jgi:hypothetical protein